jgi:tetratricopeptide (TPR) repeat protein
MPLPADKVSSARRAAAPPRSGRWWRRRMALLTAACLLALGGAGYVLLAPAADAYRHWQQAENAAADADFEQARGHLARCLQVWPRSAAVHFLLARTLRRAGAFDDAVRELDEGERLGWAPEGVALERALLQAQAGRLAPLEQALRRRGSLTEEEDLLVRETLVAGYLQCYFLDRAYQVTSKWLADHPGAWQAHAWHGRVLEQGLKADLAIEAYRHALELRPGHRPTHWRLGDLLLRRNRPAEAAPHFETCLQGDPRHGGARLGLARCRRAAGTLESARATLQPLLDEQPDHAGACLLRGQLAADADQLEEGLAWLRRAAAGAPHDVETNYALAQVLRRLGRPADAEGYERRGQQDQQDYKRLEQIIGEVAQKPGDAALRREAGAILVQRDEVAEGARWLLSALQVDPADRETRRALRDCLPRLADPRLTDACRKLLEE